MRNIHIILILFGLFLCPQLQNAQIVTLKTDTVNVSCTSSDTFTIPVKVLNFNNLGGLQFSLEWDKTKIKYIFIQDFNTALGNGFVNMDTTTHLSNGQLTFAWLDPGGLTIPNSGNNTLFKVAFVRLGGSFSPLSFDTTALPNPPPTAITVSDPNFNALPFVLSIGGMKTTDNTLPTINCPSNVIVTSSGPIPVNNIAPAVADNCGIDHTGWTATGATNLSFPNDPDASGTLFNVGQTQVVYTTTDVGGNTATCSFIIDVQFDPATGDTLTLLASSGTADCGQVFYTDISVLNFDSIFGAQFSLSWLTSVLQFDSVALLNQSVNVSAANFNLSFVQNGTPAGSGNLSFGWNSDNFTAGSTLPNGAVLFRVYFTANGANGAVTGINFTDFPAGLLSIDPNLDPVYTKYIAGLFSVDDNVAPTIQCPANQAVTAVLGQTTAVVTGLAPLNLSDNCSGNVLLTYTPTTVGAGNGSGPANGTYPGGTSIVTYTATDAAGNTSTCSFLVTVDLGEIFELKIDSVQYQCGSGATTIGIPFRVYNFDNIGGMNFRVSWDETVLAYNGFSNVFPGMSGVSGGSFPSSGTTSLQGFLNFLAVSPTGQWPNIPDGGVVFQLNFTVLNANAATGFNFEQPEGAIDGAFTPVPFNFVDGGFSSVDVSAPVVTCPNNQTVAGNANCTALVNLTATAIDACGTVTSLVNNAPVGNVFPAGSTQVVFTATDNAGNIGFCSMTVTVNANTALQIIDCPTAPIVISAINNCSAPITYPIITAINPCISNANFIYSCNFLPGSIRPVGLTNVVCTATQLGNGGGLVTCNFQVVVVDDGSPQLQCPQGITIAATGSACYALNPVLPVPVVTDNCDQNLIPFIDPDLVDTLYVGLNTLIYLATDNSGNVGACSFNVTVSETQPPTVICAEPVEVTAGANCQGIATWDAPSASDNCTATGDLDITSIGGASGDLFDVGETTVIYTVTDGSGNTATCSLSVTVVETTPPTIAGCPVNYIIILPVDQCDTTITWTLPQANDNCGIASFSANFNPGTTFPSGITTVVYTAVDLAGNTATCSFSVTAVDKVSPVFVTFPNDTLITDADPCGAILNIAQPTAMDNCDPNPLITYAGNLQDTFPIGITIIEILVTDASGNVTKDTLTITVNSLNVKSFANIPGNQNLTGCAQAATWTPPDIQGFCETPVITSSAVSGSVFPIGTTIVTYTATDITGSISATFSITVTDPEAPVFNCPQPVILSAAGVVISDPSGIVESIATADNCQSADLVMNIPTVTDNCTQIPEVIQTGGPSPDGIYPIGTYTLTYKATDEFGNTSTCSYTVVVAPFEIEVVTAAPNPGCEGEMVVLSVPSIPGATYSWTGPKASYPNATTVTIGSLSQDQTGSYGVTVSLNGCMANGGTVNVVMSTKPTAIDDLSYTISAGETLEGTSILANDQFPLPTDITIAQKSPLIGLTLNADGTFSYVSEKAGAYSFIYEICSIACPDLCDMATVTITVRDIDCDFVPNIFTPNGDMSNDYFEIPCLDSGLYPNNTLVIYSQWGDKVFEAKGYANTVDKAWNGTLNNESGKDLPDGVYYYIFQQDSDTAALKGYVHIYR
jgi:gliding motility-associated-like protein